MEKERRSLAAGFRIAINAAPLRTFQILLVLAVLLVLVIDGVDLQLLSLVAPLILDEWGLNRSEFGIALSAALIGMSLGALGGGTLGDRYGRRRALIGATVLFGAATIAAALTQTILALTILRLISGLGFGAAAPNAIALASDWLPDRLRPQVTSLLSIGTPAGGMVGALLVISILPQIGWRGAFYACGALTVMLIAIVLIFVRESPSFYLARGDSDGASASVRQNLGFEFQEAPAPLGSQSGAELAASDSFLSRSLLRLNVGAGLGFFALSFVSYAFIAWTPIMLSSVGFTVEQSITAALGFNMSAVVAALAGGFVMKTYGTKRVLASVSTILVIVLLALAVVLQKVPVAPNGALLWATYILVGLSGGFAGAGMASLYTIMAVGYPPVCRAGGIGFGLMMGRIGGILASFFGGYLLDFGGAGSWLFLLVLAACAILAVLCSAISDRHVMPIGR